MKDDDRTKVHIIDVSPKAETLREAVAKGSIRMKKETVDLILAGKMKKGDVLAVAQVAGVMAAKSTPSLIPLCHPLRITGADIDFKVGEDIIEIVARVRCLDRTGVEMEALTAVTAAALTIYDMCKWTDRGMEIGEIHLVSKTGGKSGNYQAK
ncbi:MAG: cyclic pyranopterin monophosphate synthase MoaC [Actinomycetota bacterium]|nr:cyclic pyranopterin monophosphate synthase MoaC [Actinomycetota bacterium]